MSLDNYVCDGQMSIEDWMQQEEAQEVTESFSKYPNCSQDEIDYILPILRLDASENMREEVYKMVKVGQSDSTIINGLKHYYKPWRRDNGKEENEYVLNFPGDMRYQAVITYPDGMELRRKPGDTTGCCVNTWSHTLVLIKDMIAAGDYVEVPEIETHPTLLRGYTCKYDHTCWCNRYGNELPIEEYKVNLIKGFSCAGCCRNCKESSINGGRCRWDCRLKKHE